MGTDRACTCVSIQKAAHASCNRVRIRKMWIGNETSAYHCHSYKQTPARECMVRRALGIRQPISMSFSGSAGRTKKKATVSANPNHHTCNLFSRCYTLFSIGAHHRSYGGVNAKTLPLLYYNAFM